MNLHFDHPAVLLLGLIALPVVAVGWVNLVGLDRVRRVIVVGLRALLLAAMAIMLAGPHTIQEHDQLTVIGLLDVSGSVRRFADLPATDELAGHSNLEYLRRWFRQATQTKMPDDRFGLIVFDGQAIAIATPTKGEYVDDNIDATMLEGTNIAQAIQLGLAMFPPDTAKRLVLVTDGNETSGDTYEAARRAAAAPGGQGVRIDVLPIAYSVTSDVQIARLETPASAQPGQTVTVRIILESTAPVSGRLILLHEGMEVDLNGRRPGTSRRIEVPVGRSVHLAQVPLGETPVNRFEAIFEPDVPEADALADNNRAEAFTSTPSKGTVLVVDPRLPAQQDGPNALAQTLEQAGIPVRAEPPERFPTDLLSLQAYDLIILDNVAAVDLDRRQHELLSRYVNHLGGGLIMVGGENSFGAGGWNGSALEDVLPVELDPPKELRLPTAALVLVLDKSGSMNRPVAGTRSTQQEVANEAAALAVESLRADTLIGVVTFDLITHVRVPPRRNDDSRWIADRIRGITAGGGTNLGPALRRAHEMLKSVDVAKKRVVCLTDGQSPTAGLDEIVEAMAADGIKLTTIAVGDGADRVTLERLAELGGGTFYTVRNPRILPRVLVDSVQVINKPLIKEVPFVPVVHPTGSALTVGMDAAPQLGGLVVTAARPDPTVTVEMTHPDGEPLLAHWQAGLGRVAVFTSDAQGNWSDQWLDWPGYDAFWTQLARTIARPPMSRDTELTVDVRDDRLWITLEATGERGAVNYLEVDGSVYAPDGEVQPVRLRQVAPGLYETSVAARSAGNYIVALSPRRGTRRLAPVIGGVNRPTSPEFRRYRSNLALLNQVAEVTGGRRLDISNPVQIDLFDRTGMPATFSTLPAWRAVLWLTLVLIVLDTACRRLAWSTARVRRWVAQAVARVTPAHVRGEEAAATLATLRRASAEVDQRWEAHARSAPARPETPTAQEPPPAERLAHKAPPEPSEVAAALDSLLGRHEQEPPPPPPHEEPPRQREDEEPAAAPSSETTSSLLAAKKRARQRLDETDEGRGTRDEKK